MRNNFWGMDGFVWFYGVVEDRMDPLQVGRLRVRVYGWHNEDKQKIPTDGLLWALPMIPLDSGRANTVGAFEGTRVLGFFIDGPHAQEAIILGRIPGFPEKEADPEVGYNDPREDSVLEGHQVPREPKELTQHDDGSGNDIEEQDVKSRFPDKDYIPEPETSRYARGRDGGYIEKTIVPLKESNVEIGQTDVPTAGHPAGTGTDVASPATDWTEEKTHYDTKYPYNKAYYSEGGHLIEIDDTPGKERLHWYHRVGTFREINEVGCQVDKIVDKHYDIVLRERHTHIEAALETTVDWYHKLYVNKDGMAGFNYDSTVGPGGDYNITTEDGKLNIYVNGDVNLYCTRSAYVEVDENLIAMVHKEAHVTVDENAYVHIKKDLNAHIEGDCKIKVDGDLEYSVDGDMTGHVQGDRTEFVGGDYKVICAGNIEHYALGKIKEVALSGIDESTAGSILSQAAVSISETAGVSAYRLAGAEISDTAGAGCFRNAGGEVSDTAGGGCYRLAGGEISDTATLLASRVAGAVSDTAGIISHNAPVTNCAGILTGITEDSGGDVTLPGPPGPIGGNGGLGGVGAAPEIIPGIIATAAAAVADAIVVEITQDAPQDVIPDALDSLLTDAEAMAEQSISDVEGNANAPGAAGGAAGGAGGGGGGGDKGGIPLDGPGGFLWKPVGDNSGVLTVLYPGQGGVNVYRAIPDGEEEVEEITETTNPDGTITRTPNRVKKPRYKKGALIESLPYIKTFHGDGRGIHRGSRPGSGYGPEPVICTTPQGEYFISNPALRHD